MWDEFCKMEGWVGLNFARKRRWNEIEGEMGS